MGGPWLVEGWHSRARSFVAMDPPKLAQELSGKSKPIQEKLAPICEVLIEMARAAVMEKAVPLLMVGRS